MENHGDVAVNSKKTIFMKQENSEWIMHGLFVDDMRSLRGNLSSSTKETLKSPAKIS
jgi:hypothetical protein